MLILLIYNGLSCFLQVMVKAVVVRRESWRVRGALQCGMLLVVQCLQKWVGSDINKHLKAFRYPGCNP